MNLHTTQPTAACPRWQQSSHRIHSRYRSWDYPSDLIAPEQRLKQQKQQFQQTHAPVAGRVVIGSIKLAS